MKTCRIHNIGDAFKSQDVKNTLLSLNYKISEIKGEDREIWLIEKMRQTGVIFNHGCVVLWNFDKMHEEILLKNLQKCLEIPYKNLYFDEFEYQKSSIFSIKNDFININSFAKEIILALSYAMAQSIELERLEFFLNELIQPMIKTADELEQKGNIKISSRNIKKFIGSILRRKHEINLKLNLLDTPDYFWENPDIESYYTKMRLYLEINNRVVSLNQKLAVLQDSMEILRDEKNTHLGTKLEFIIVVLIIFEVIMAIVRG